MAKDYYQILGVPRGASADEIKKAYRTAAHQHHPDKESGDEARFKEVNEAYQVLGNAEKKARYDRTGSADGMPGGGYGGGGFSGFGQGGFDVNMEDLGDIFSSVFQGGFGGGAPRREERGRDLHVEIRISLEEAFKGGTHSFRIPAQVTCTTCTGSGAAEGSKLETCKTCSGKGQVTQTRRVLFGQFEQRVICTDCEGSGKVPEKPCKDCHGAGRKKGERDVTVKVEAGIRDGQMIAMPDMGDAGRRGLPTGTLGVVVRVARHNIFDREGDDLLTDMKVTPLELLAHEPIEVPSIEGGKTPVTIGANIDLAQYFRVKGQGMPHFRGKGRGDLLVKFHVVTTKKPSKKEVEKLFES